MQFKVCQKDLKDRCEFLLAARMLNSTLTLSPAVFFPASGVDDAVWLSCLSSLSFLVWSSFSFCWSLTVRAMSASFPPPPPLPQSILSSRPRSGPPVVDLKTKKKKSVQPSPTSYLSMVVVKQSFTCPLNRKHFGNPELEISPGIWIWTVNMVYGFRCMSKVGKYVLKSSTLGIRCICRFPKYNLTGMLLDSCKNNLTIITSIIKKWFMNYISLLRSLLLQGQQLFNCTRKRAENCSLLIELKTSALC